MVRSKSGMDFRRKGTTDFVQCRVERGISPDFLFQEVGCWQRQVCYVQEANIRLR